MNALPPLRRNRDFGQFAEARRDTVGDGTLRDELIDDTARRSDALLGMRGERDKCAVASNGCNVLERQRIPVNDDFIVHAGNVSGLDS